MVKRATLAILGVLLCVLYGCTAAPSDSLLDGYESCRKQVFGNGIVFSASVRGGDTRAALQEMQTLFEEIEADMSLSKADSALSKFNALGAGEQPSNAYESERVRVSRHTYETVLRAMAFYEETQGAFNVAVYPLSRLWHIDTDGLNRYTFAPVDECPAPPAYEEVLQTIDACDIRRLHCEENDGAYYLYKTDPRLQIDLGAVAKGYAADECIRIAKAHGVRSAIIDVSGNISLLGEWYRPAQKAYTPWNIGVTAPRPARGLGGNVCALGVSADKTLVTSGDYERFYVTRSGGNELWVPHIVNGKTGLPLGVAYTGDQYVNTGDHIISATVICNDSAKADAYATAVCLLGKSEGAAFLRAHGMRGLLITADNVMCLVDVNEQSEEGEVYFTLKNEYAAYTRYTLETAR